MLRSPTRRVTQDGKGKPAGEGGREKHVSVMLAVIFMFLNGVGEGLVIIHSWYGLVMTVFGSFSRATAW